MQIESFPGLGRIFRRFERMCGFAMSEENLVGVSVTERGGRRFAHLLSRPQQEKGWGVPIEPVRFFARRAVIPKDFAGREAEYIRYNQPDLIPLPDPQTIALRFSPVNAAGETVLHGIRKNRMEEFLDDRRSDGKLPKLSGIIPPSIALAAAIGATRPVLPSKTLAILVGAGTTRYVALKDGVLINVFDDVHRPDRKDMKVRFRKTLLRVLGYMETEGLGAMPDAILLMGDPAAQGWVEDAKKSAEGALAEFFDLPAAIGLVIPAEVSAEMAILAFGAAVASNIPALNELNFTGVPRAEAARRFDAYDLIMYGSLAVMVALAFITLNAFTRTRIHALNESLRTNTERILLLREELESKRGVVPVAEKLIQYSEQRAPDPAQVGRRVMDSLPEFFALISESIPEGVRLDRVGSGDATLTDETPQAYRSLLPKKRGLRQITVVGASRSPEKAMAWVDRLSVKLGSAVAMEEMKLDPAGGLYHFRIVIASEEPKPRA